MYAAYGRATQAGIERRAREKRDERLRLHILKPEPPKSPAQVIQLFPAAPELPIECVPYTITLASIERRACKLFGCTRAELRGDKRNREIVIARHFVMYWAARLLTLSLPVIGRHMRRDHTSILHGKESYRIKRRHGFRLNGKFTKSRTLRAAR